MRKLPILLIALILPGLLFAQTMPSEQFVLWKVWSSDSAALKNLGYGDNTFSLRDTVVLEGSDTDTVTIAVSDARGYFSVWLVPDTANFEVDGEQLNHQIGDSDSLSLSYRPKVALDYAVGNDSTQLDFLNQLDWEAEKAYYESFYPALSDSLVFYITHTGETDTSAVIIEIKWQ